MKDKLWIIYPTVHCTLSLVVLLRVGWHIKPVNATFLAKLVVLVLAVNIVNWLINFVQKSEHRSSSSKSLLQNKYTATGL